VRSLPSERAQNSMSDMRYHARERATQRAFARTLTKWLLEPAHNGGNDRFEARLGILTIFKIAFFVYGNRN
jgi:hypothetical protein